MEIGNKIQELRRENNLSQEQLAEKLDVARQTISKWELGETSPDLKQAKKLSQLFNVSLDELTNNDINNVIIEKVSNTEKLAGIIIKILKVFGIVFLLIIIIGIIFVFCRKYFEVKPNYMVSDSYGIYCEYNDKKIYYEVTTNRDESGFELNEDTKEIIDTMNIDINKYSSKEKLIKDVEKYIESHNGNCN